MKIHFATGFSFDIQRALCLAKMYSKLEFTLQSSFAILLLFADRFFGQIKRIVGVGSVVPNYTHGVNLTGHIVVVTGANIGIGRETAINLVRCGATVVLGCRDIQKGMQAASEINSSVKSVESVEKYPFGPKGRAVFMRLDLSELASVVEFADKVKDEFPRVDTLINNAGLNTGGKLASGLEQLFQVNYLGHYLLVRCLESHLVAKDNGVSAPAVGRVINLSSVMHHTGQPDFKASSTRGFTVAEKAKYSYYSDSKLYMNYLTSEVNRRLDAGRDYSLWAGENRPPASSGRPVVAISVNPGAVRSDIWRNAPFQRIYNAIMKLIFLEVEEGCASSVFAATVSLNELRAYQKEAATTATDEGGRFVKRPDVPYIVPYKVSCLAHEALGVYYGCFYGGVTLPTPAEVMASRADVRTEDASPTKQAAELWKYSAELCVKNLLQVGVKEGDVAFLI